MRILTAFIFAQLLYFSAFSQANSYNFPQDFFGIYSGNLLIHTENGAQTVPMEFHLKETDTLGRYHYILIYSEGESRQVRNYALIEKNKEKGQYIVDENNGILLENKVVGNSMFALFEVNNNLLTTFITFREKDMVFEITSAHTPKKIVSYSEDQQKIEVKSYPISTVQRAVLKKQ